MKKFIKIISAYLLLLCLLTLGVNAVYEGLGLGMTDNIQKFFQMPAEIRLCNFGSSHGRDSFFYGELEEKGLQDYCFNFALSSQSLSYDARLLQFYQERLSEGAVVFIPVSYFSLYGIPENESYNFADKNTRYYSLLPSEYIKECSWTVALMVKYPVLLAGPQLLPRMVEAVTEREKAGSTAGINGTNAQAAAEYAGIVVKNHLFFEKMDDGGERILNQEELDALYEMIALCRARGATPILITTPYLAEYNQEVGRADPDFLESFHALIAQVQRETGAEYYDYSADERFCGEYSLFMNSDHLNRAGARLFTSILMDEVVGDRLSFS